MERQEFVEYWSSRIEDAYPDLADDVDNIACDAWGFYKDSPEKGGLAAAEAALRFYAKQRGWL